MVARAWDRSGPACVSVKESWLKPCTVIVIWYVVELKLITTSSESSDEWLSFTIDIYNQDQFCSGRTIFVVIAGPTGPFMSNICGLAGPFMHPDQIFCYRRHKIRTLLLEFRVLRHEHTRYACCACIKEKQIVVTTEFCNQRL